MSSTALVAGGVFLAGAVLAFAAVTGSRHALPHWTRTAAGRAGPAAPLELVALEDDRDGDRFIVRGIVRNPAPSPVDGLVADVSVYGPGGGLTTSGHAAVEALKLAGGAETPFVVIVDGAGDVDRYHLSFRTHGGVVPHLDRRVHSVLAGWS